MIAEHVGLFSGIHYIPYDEMMILYDPDVRPMLEEQSEFVDGVRELLLSLEMHGLKA